MHTQPNSWVRRTKRSSMIAPVGRVKRTPTTPALVRISSSRSVISARGETDATQAVRHQAQAMQRKLVARIVHHRLHQQAARQPERALHLLPVRDGRIIVINVGHKMTVRVEMETRVAGRGNENAYHRRRAEASGSAGADFGWAEAPLCVSWAYSSSRRWTSRLLLKFQTDDGEPPRIPKIMLLAVQQWLANTMSHAASMRR